MGQFTITEHSYGPFTFETGRIARQSDGSVLASFGDTMVLATVNREPADEGQDFFPLSVDFEEKFYAGGKIPGGFFKREGKPSEDATLNARMIDRPIRPLFPDGYSEKLHVVVTVLSADIDHAPETIGLLGASAALMISSVPFQGPVAGVRVALVNDEFVLNPTAAQKAESSMDIIVAGTEHAVTMVEGEMKEIPEDRVIEAIQLAHEEIKRLSKFQKEFIAKIPNLKTKIEVTPPEKTSDLHDALKAILGDRLDRLWGPIRKHERQALEDQIRDEAIQGLLDKRLAKEPDLSESEQAKLTHTLKGIFNELIKEFVRVETLARKERYDGRRADEVRSIACEVGILPRVHGSALFTRGETQSLGTCTLGTTRQDEQIVDLMLEEGRKRFMLHYNFPPYSVGETGRLGPPKRREIGHGNLAATALKQVLPSEDDFPYIIRVVSEILESNGSSSMASVCSGTLAMMDAGVPISKPVAGIAMGLIEENGDAMILTDIAGYEDHMGDMDFKVAGTRDGITAFQLDVKSSGLHGKLMEQAMAQARKARLEILGHMNETLAEHRSELSKYAPIIELFKISPEKIGAIIGPGGKTIRKILAETSAEIDIEDDGTVKVSGASKEIVNAARAQIEDLVKEIEIGEAYTGKVVRIEKFGAFVELKPGVQGLVHVSDLSDKYVKNVEDIVKIGDTIEVEVTEVDNMGRINLRRKTERKERKERKIGDLISGRVKGIADYGAFVEFEDGESGLVHISMLVEGKRVEKVEDVVNVGDPVTVEIIRIDDKGRYSLKLVSKDGSGGNGAARSMS
jgi:polyribonucleotide nucleotidyltransferase